MIVERFITARRATSRQQMFEPSKNVDVGPVSTHTHRANASYNLNLLNIGNMIVQQMTNNLIYHDHELNDIHVCLVT